MWYRNSYVSHENVYKYVTLIVKNFNEDDTIDSAPIWIIIIEF